MVNLTENAVGSIRRVPFQGKEILWAEFGQKSEEDALQMMEIFVSDLAARPDRSILLLADLNRACFFSNVAIQWQDYQATIHSKCSKIAVVGAHQVVAWAAKSFIHLAGKAGWPLEEKVGFFDYSDQAMRWLVKGDTNELAADFKLSSRN